MRIARLEIENFMRLRAVVIEPDGDTVELRGRNAQGKTSVLRAIETLVRDARSAPAKVIRRGEMEARVMADLGNLIIERTWRAGANEEETSKLVVRRKDGRPVVKPQAVLDELYGHLTFNPLRFFSMEGKQQVDELRGIVGLNFASIDAEQARLYEQRTRVNRDLEQAKALVARLPNVPASKPVDLASLSAEMAKWEGERRTTEQLARNRDAALELCARGKGEIERCERIIADAQQKLVELKAHMLESAKKAEDIATDIELRPDATSKLEGLRAQLGEAEQKNRAAAQHAERERALEAQKARQKETDTLSVEMDKLKGQKDKALAEAKFPVEGLGFTDAEVTLNGLPLSQASGAERLRVSLAIGCALNPQLKVMLIQDASLLDDDGLRLVKEQAAKSGMQLWLEMVGTGGSGVLIEDGAVAHG